MAKGFSSNMSDLTGIWNILLVLDILGKSGCGPDSSPPVAAPAVAAVTGTGGGTLGSVDASVLAVG
jgi:hypothetical protein